MSIANNIKTLRKNRGLTQKQLAKAIGTIQKVITDYETGKSTPPSDRLVKLARFFEVSIDEIVGTKEIELTNHNAEKVIHGNTRTVQLVKLFEQLSEEEQRTTLKQIKALVELKKKKFPLT